MAESGCRVIELNEGSEVERIESNEYIFDKIGASVPLSPGDSHFDPSTLPSQPLVISQTKQLLFVANSEDGFIVARTPDVIQSAKEFKEQGTCPSLRELSVVNVPIGKVHILALSRGSRMIAASVAGDIHFFLVKSLLSKEPAPHFSCSLNAPEIVKDMRWTNKNGMSYIVLSNKGKLYHSVVGGGLQHVFDDVDAVDWSSNEGLVALARKNSLNILSHNFKELLCMSLCFDEWVDSANDDESVRVDSIRWVRPDCIILGCLKVTAEGTEENYFVQAISVNEGSFTDASSAPIVSSFDELFTGIMDDVVPFGTGPHLFLSYLRQCELGIIANKKNVDQHINLISWSSGDIGSEVAIVEFNRDKWAPRIPLQDNDDDNVIVGLCIDEVSKCEKVRFQQGVDDPRELSPYCVMFCLTLEGKLIMFHLASVSDSPTRHQSTMFSDDEITSETSYVGPDQSKVVCDTEQAKLKGSISRSQSVEVSNIDHLQMEASEGPKRNDTTNSKILGNTAVYTGLTSPETKTKEPPEQHILPVLEQNNGTLRKSANFDLPTTNFKSSLGTYNLSQASQGFKDGSKLNSSKNIGVASSYASSEKPFNDSQSRISMTDFNKLSKSSTMAIGERGMPLTNSFSDEPSGGSLFSSSSNSQSHKHSSSDNGGFGTNINKEFAVKHFSSKMVPTSTSPFQPPSTKISSSGDPKVSPRIEALPSVRKSQQLFQQQNISANEFQSLNNQTKPFNGKLNTDANLSKGSANIREMTEQLDKLLKDLEETGGLVDPSTGLTNSADALSHGLEALACKCKTWKSILKERHEEIHDLLDKTVQALARKTYAEGIVKQASDTQYWDLWDRQGLGFELNMKHRNINKIHQELTNQLIQLEMHFNNLELNKFGQKDRGCDSKRGLQNQLREPRRIQSLHSLQNTMNTQLIVAEQLSQCLSEQMALLNVDSPCQKPQNVKRDLFKTIGLPIDASAFNSPGCSSLEKQSGRSFSASVKDQAKRNQTSGYKYPEPETARRRRESLGRSLVAFEPHKTTVRRSPLREGRKTDLGKSLSIPCMLEESVSSQQKERRTPSTLYPSQNSVVRETVTLKSERTSGFKWVSKDTGLLQCEGPVSPRKACGMPISTQPISSKPLFGHRNANAGGSLISEKAVVKGINGRDRHDSKSTLLDDAKDDGASLGTPHNKSPLQGQHMPLHRSTIQGNFSISSKGMGTQSAQEFVSSETPAIGFKGTNLDGMTSQSHSGSTLFSFPGSSSLFSSASSVPAAVSSFSKPSPLAYDPRSKPLNNPKSTSEASRPTSPLSTAVSLISSESPATTSSESHATTSEVVKSEVPQHLQKEDPSRGGVTYLMDPKVTVAVAAESASADTVTPTINFTKKEGDYLPEVSVNKSTEDGKPHSSGIGASAATSQSGFSCKPEEPTVSEQKSQEGVESSEQPSFVGVSNVTPNSVLKSQQEQPISTFSGSGSASTEKTEVSGNAGYQEEEMEEETPEVSPVAELSLGSLGAFGLGSAPPQAAVTSGRNPFGGSLGSSSASPVSSPFTMPSSGNDMFRPASFSFSPTQSQQAPSPPTAFGGFGSSATPVGFGFAANQAPSGGGFGQPTQVGQGQQALGSALGSFGQSRQIGIANSFAPVSSFGSGFTGNQSGGGFANAATKSGGFASLASNSGGFAAAASANPGGFNTGSPAVGAVPQGGSGFGGFAGAAGSGGGFGAAGGSGFGQQGSSFPAFGGTGAKPPAQLLTQMRK